MAAETTATGRQISGGRTQPAYDSAAVTKPSRATPQNAPASHVAVGAGRAGSAHERAARQPPVSRSGWALIQASAPMAPPCPSPYSSSAPVMISRRETPSGIGGEVAPFSHLRLAALRRRLRRVDAPSTCRELGINPDPQGDRVGDSWCRRRGPAAPGTTPVARRSAAPLRREQKKKDDAEGCPRGAGVAR